MFENSFEFEIHEGTFEILEGFHSETSHGFTNEHTREEESL